MRNSSLPRTYKKAESDLAWLAGLLEGEGSFIEFRDTRSRAWRCKVYLKMTDLDIIERAHRIAGVGRICEANAPSKPKHWQEFWQWQVQSVPDALYVMLGVLPYMGERRSEKIQEILHHAVEEGWLYVGLKDLERYGVRPLDLRSQSE